MAFPEIAQCLILSLSVLSMSDSVLQPFKGNCEFPFSVLDTQHQQTLALLVPAEICHIIALLALGPFNAKLLAPFGGLYNSEKQNLELYDTETVTLFCLIAKKHAEFYCAFFPAPPTDHHYPGFCNRLTLSQLDRNVLGDSLSREFLHSLQISQPRFLKFSAWDNDSFEAIVGLDGHLFSVKEVKFKAEWDVCILSPALSWLSQPLFSGTL